MNNLKLNVGASNPNPIQITEKEFNLSEKRIWLSVDGQMKQIKTFCAVRDIDKIVNEFIKDKELYDIKIFYRDPHYHVTIIYETK